MPSYTFTAPDGKVWASKFEYQVHEALRDIGAPLRKCEQGGLDTFAYTESQTHLRCLECGSTQCVQERTYTPDLYVASDEAQLAAGQEERAYYIEAKGYLRQDKRGIFRHFRKAWPTLDLRIVAQSNHKVGKSRLTQWAWKYCRVECWVWNPDKDDVTDVVPEEWMIWL